MKVYLIFKEEWDTFCYEGRTSDTSIYGVFTDKKKALTAASSLNEKDGFFEKGIGDFGLESTRGIIYQVHECETNVVGEIDNIVNN